MMSMKEFVDGCVEDAWAIVGDPTQDYHKRERAFLMLCGAMMTFTPDPKSGDPDENLAMRAIAERLHGMPTGNEGLSALHLIIDAMATGNFLRSECRAANE